MVLTSGTETLKTICGIYHEVSGAQWGTGGLGFMVRSRPKGVPLAAGSAGSLYLGGSRAYPGHIGRGSLTGPHSSRVPGSHTQSQSTGLMSAPRSWDVALGCRGQCPGIWQR
jgi:hypothetical protein